MALVAAVALSGCTDRDQVQVALYAHRPPSETSLRLEIQAQVTGRPAGLHYRWFAVSGECDPQESDQPATAFRFADGVDRDRVLVEVWRGDARVAQSEIDVAFTGPGAGLPAPASPSDVQIEITTVPPWDVGGADTHADIAGKVSGKYNADARVVIYARAYESWFIQPASGALHQIGQDNRWSTWTHTGENYAVLLVRPDFAPLPRLDMLPRVGGAVLARTMVEGIKIPAETPAR